MKRKAKRALKWLLPALIAAEAALVWSGVLGVRDAVFVVAGIEVLLALITARQLLVVARRYRRGRGEGLDAWSALEDGLAAVLPRKVARVVILEPRLWVCLARWVFRRTEPRENEFGYHERSTMGMLVLMVVLTGPIEALVLHLLVPWAWLRWALLATEVYAMLWFLGFYASLSALPHRLEQGGVRLRYGAFAEGYIPYAEIEGVERAVRRASGGGDGLRPVPEEDAAYLAVTGKTDLTLRLKTPRTIRGLFRTIGPVAAVHLSADDPKRLARELKRRVGEAEGDTSVRAEAAG